MIDKGDSFFNYVPQPEWPNVPPLEPGKGPGAAAQLEKLPMHGHGAGKPVGTSRGFTVAEAARFVAGDDFVLDIPQDTPAVWGTGQRVLWPEGEALMIAGGPGLAKTTLAGQLVMGRLGLGDELLGLPVVPGKRVLYLAMDRPAQTQRALARLFIAKHRPALAERLVVWKGPRSATWPRTPTCWRRCALRRTRTPFSWTA